MANNTKLPMWGHNGYIARAVMIVSLSLLVVSLIPSRSADAAAAFVQSQTTTANNGTSVSVALPTAATGGNLIIAVCAAGATSTLSLATTGYTVGAPSAGTTVSQAIFYKVAVGGETSITCNSSARARLGAQIFEYSGLLPASPFDATQTANATTGTALSSGTASSTTNLGLAFAAYVANAGTAYTVTTSGATERSDFLQNAIHFGSTELLYQSVGAKTIAVTNSASAAWRGQIVLFKATPPVLTADIVNAINVSVPNPSVAFSSREFSFNCEVSTGALGTTTEQIRVVNTTTNNQWTLSVAATGGATAQWADGGSNRYDYNDPNSGGCSDGSDNDATGGQLAINPSLATITPDSGCSATGISPGGQTAFNEGVVDSIILLSASAAAQVGCGWNVTGITLSQQIPAEPSASTYSLGLTITLTAN